VLGYVSMHIFAGYNQEAQARLYCRSLGSKASDMLALEARLHGPASDPSPVQCPCRAVERSINSQVDSAIPMSEIGAAMGNPFSPCSTNKRKALRTLWILLNCLQSAHSRDSWESVERFDQLRSATNFCYLRGGGGGSGLCKTFRLEKCFLLFLAETDRPGHHGKKTAYAVNGGPT